MRFKFILGWMVLFAGLLFSGQSFASNHDGTPEFVKQERLVQALINIDVYVDPWNSEPHHVAESQPVQVTNNGEILVMNPHGHIHWYKPYFNHTHFNKPLPDHTHWYINNYVAVDTLAPVKPIIVAATINPDNVL